MRYVSLFAGIGGFDLALNRLGHECVYVNEWDKYSAQTYEKNFGHKPDTKSITDVPASDVPDHDILCGGFPCQSFSVAGKRGGFEDTRGTLFNDIARIAKAKRPTYLLLENVKGLLSHDNGRTFEVILRTFDELGYDLQWQVCNSKDFDVPQSRERIYIVGHRRGEPRPQVFPITRDAIYRPGTVALIDRSYPSRVRVYRSVAPTVRDYGAGGNKMPLVNGIRRMTPVECERLQGFPDGWTEGVSDTQRYKQLGNAVTVNVIYEIAMKL